MEPERSQNAKLVLIKQDSWHSLLLPSIPKLQTCYRDFYKSVRFQPFKAINKKGGKRVKSAKSKKVDVLTKESKRVFDEPKEEEVTEELPETKKDLFEDGDDDEGKLITFHNQNISFCSFYV